MTGLVGILNLTPDSFADGGQFNDPAVAIERAAQLFQDGAELIDVGAEATSPNATPLTDEEEWARLEPVLSVLIPRYPGKISLDSYHPATIRKAFAVGPVIINDVTSFNNPEMVKLAAELKATVVINHSPNMPIQEAHRREPVTTVQQVVDDLLRKALVLQQAGLPLEQIILDPGIGFGKTMELNEKLLSFAELVRPYAVMIGYSKKRFLGEHRMELAPNLMAGRIAMAHGARYLRVHDVADHHRELL